MRRIRLLPLALLSQLAAGADFTFDLTYVDLAYGGNGKPGWVRSGDLDGDGDLDLMAGGGFALFAYESDGAGGWSRHGSLDGTGAIGANGGELYDVDGDGDLDAVSAHFYDDLGWWENPGGPLDSRTWAFHALGSASWYLHDVIRADLDGDGALEEFVFNLISGGIEADVRIEWFRVGAEPAGPWEVHVLEAGRDDGQNNHAGLDAADVDGDGDVDLAYSNGWYESSGDPAGAWTWHPVTEIYGLSNALLRDMDGDGTRDLVVSAGHHGNGVYWLESPPSPAMEPWTQHDLDAGILHPECLAVLDLDRDGDLDVVSCDLDFDKWELEIHNVYVFENLGDSLSWNLHNVAPDSYPSHLLQTVDLDRDTRVDLISEATGYSVISHFANASTEGALQPLLVDDFEDGSLPPGWTFQRGGWSEEQGALVGVPEGAQATFASALARPALPPCQRCAVHALMEAVDGTGPQGQREVTLLGWVSNRLTNVGVVLKPAQDRVVLRQTEEGLLVGAAVAEAHLEEGRPYRVEVDYDGARFLVLLDGVPLIDAPDAFAAPPGGTVALQARNVTVRLHDLFVGE